MEINKIKELKSDIGHSLLELHVVQALETLKTLVDAAASWQLTEEWTKIKSNYNLMLQYMEQGMLDPQRHEILAQIIRRSLLLTDKCVIELSEAAAPDLFYFRYKQCENMSLTTLINDYRVERNKLRVLQGAVEARNEKAIFMTLEKCEGLENNIFDVVWSTFPTPQSQVDTLMQLMQDDDMPVPLKSLVLSAMMLGATKFFDETKVLFLLNCYDKLAGNNELRLRALINAVIVMHKYRRRLKHYPAISTRVEHLAKRQDFVTHLPMIFTRLINSRNTDNITRKMHEGIMPELRKMKPDLFNKIHGSDPASLDMSDIEENPQWQEWLDKSGITRKLEEFNELQMQGGDVFISAFSRLKNHRFFNTLSHWFLPYHEDCTAVLGAFGAKKHPLISLFMAIPIICDSDKFSIVLSIAESPESQRSMMFSQFEAQREQFKDLDENEAQNIIKLDDNIINRYVQDLYRFFKLHSRRREFISSFDSDFNLLEVDCLEPMLHNTETIQVIAEFYFKNGFFNDAITFYKQMLKNRDAGAHVYQKLGYAYQQQGMLNRAIDNYLKFEIVDENDLWNLKQLALCYRALKQLDKAIEYYSRAIELAPSNVSLNLSLGHCLLENNDTEGALKQYYKVDFMEGARHRAWRPIAWCLFLTGKLKQAGDYYEKIITRDTPTAQDLLNYGHVLQAAGDTGGAIERYRKSLEAQKGDTAAFAKLYIADEKYLARNPSFSPVDYRLILETAISSFTNTKN